MAARTTRRSTPKDLHSSLRDAEPVCFWLDSTERPVPEQVLDAAIDADLLVVGGGYSGLWTALLAKERDPGRDVVLVESNRIGWAASGRNGGFCAASLTHGLGNGLARWPDEMQTLEALGRANLAAIEAGVRRYGIECNWEHAGELSVATTEHEVGGLAEEADTLRRFGSDAVFLDAAEARAEVASPTYLGAVWDRKGVAMIHPARLAWGLRDACVALGVRLYEGTAVHRVDAQRSAVHVTTPAGRIAARQVALATNAFPPLIKGVRSRIVPVYDHALATEPLTADQLGMLGWVNRQGVSDRANRFHYYRLTPDDRILWG